MLRGTVHRSTDVGFASATAMFNRSLVHRPEVVVEVSSAEEVVSAIGHARANRLPVSILGGGHGAFPPVRSGLMISTRGLTGISITGDVATIGAGERWEAVVSRAAEHGLHPITGSSPDVGVVGYLLGGGLGPLARSHGFSSDYVAGFTVVTGTGAIVEADREREPDLYYALRGGKFGLGVVTEVRLRLVPLRSLYAGSLTFAPAATEGVLRSWIEWTKTADPRVTTSLALVHPPAAGGNARPPRRAIVHFAFPGSAEEGEQLARPLRALGPTDGDDIGPMAPADIAKIHNDPRDPVIAFTDAAMLAPIDPAFGAALLGALGADSPFVGCEVRHLGSGTNTDVPEGSAVGGRGAAFALGLVAVGPAAEAGPAASASVLRALESWIAPEGNANFLSAPRGPRELEKAWSPSTRERLTEIRRRYDPDGVFAAP